MKKHLVPFLLCATPWVVAPLILGGCHDKSRRLPEHERLQYKLGLVKENYADLTEEQRYRIMYHPGRTEAEIDATLEEYVSRTRLRRDQALSSVRDRQSRALDQARRLRSSSERAENMIISTEPPGSTTGFGAGDPVSSGTGDIGTGSSGTGAGEAGESGEAGF